MTGSHDYSDWRAESLPEPWFMLPVESRGGFQGEAGREVAPGHLLFGQRLQAVAKCAGCDEVVFSTDVDGAPAFARVHLTWSGQEEAPPWPLCSTFRRLGAAVAGHEH